MTKKTLTEADLKQFSGTEVWYRHWCARKILFTEGVHFVAEHGEASWLIDEIAFAQSHPKIAAEAFQLWKLTVNANRSATLACTDGNENSVHEMAIPFTDFPLTEIKFYLTDNVLMLPGEY